GWGDNNARATSRYALAATPSSNPARTRLGSSKRRKEKKYQDRSKTSICHQEPPSTRILCPIQSCQGNNSPENAYGRIRQELGVWLTLRQAGNGHWHGAGGPMLVSKSTPNDPAARRHFVPGDRVSFRDQHP